MVGLGTDGASVMVGRHSGVAARFKQRQPLLAFIVFVIAWYLPLHRLEIILHIFVTNSNQPFPNCFILSQQLGENVWATSNREAS